MQAGLAAAHRRCRTTLTDQYIREEVRLGELVSAQPPAGKQGITCSVWEPCWWKQRLRARGILRNDIHPTSPRRTLGWEADDLAASSPVLACERLGWGNSAASVASSPISPAEPSASTARARLGRTTSLTPLGDASFGINVSLKMRPTASRQDVRGDLASTPGTPRAGRARGDEGVVEDVEAETATDSCPSPSPASGGVEGVRARWRAQVEERQRLSTSAPARGTAPPSVDSPSSCPRTHAGVGTQSHLHRPRTESSRDARRRMAADLWGGGAGGESAKLPAGTPRFCYR